MALNSKRFRLPICCQEKVVVALQIELLRVRPRAKATSKKLPTRALYGHEFLISDHCSMSLCSEHCVKVRYT